MNRTDVTVVLPQSLADDIDTKARLPVETAGVLLASIVIADDGSIRLLARQMHWVPDAAYIRRGGDHLSIASEGYVPVLSYAEKLDAVALWVHTHPGTHSSPQPSEHDKEVDRQIADLFRLRAAATDDANAKIPESSLHVAAKCAHVAVKERRNFPLREDDRSSQAKPLSYFPNAFNLRRWLAIGLNVAGECKSHRSWGKNKSSVVKRRSTGSAVAEQLVRLGVRHLTLFDPDNISGSNVTRVYVRIGW